MPEHDAHGRGDLVASVRAWLSRHGQWDAAAADLGVHRHTLRYRMRRVEEILDRSLDDPDVRMELWLALKALEWPGLWNGAMAYWNTQCVEIPLDQFAPVKTAADLMRKGRM
jgi:hypothetical protein